MDNNEQNDEKQQQLDNASQKTAHVAGKAAATYFGGAAGGQLYNAASNTKVGQAIEQTAGKALQQNPAANKTMTLADKSGALDAADKGMDIANGTQGLPNLPSNKSDQQENQNDEGIINTENIDNQEQQKNQDIENNKQEKKENLMDQLVLPKKGIKLMIISGVGFFVFLIFLIIIYLSLKLNPFINFVDFVTGSWNKLLSFFSQDVAELEENYYKQLQQVQSEIYSDKSICVDVNLITAALTVNKNFDSALDEMSEEEDADLVEESDEDNNDNSNQNDYKRMKRYIKLLANMQIKKVIYEKKEINGSNCVDVGQSTDTSLVAEGDHNSSTPELVASHDVGNFKAFFTKKENEEENNEYHVYRPPETQKTDAKGNVSTSCSVNLPNASYQLDIGDYDTMEQSVFYWNLVNSFIPDYYGDYLPEDTDENQTIRMEKIKEIAEEIYMLYKNVGPNHDCAANNQYAYSCGSIDIFNTTLTKAEFVKGIDTYNGSDTLWSLIKDNAEQIYDVAVDNGLNPEIIVTRAILEGFKPGHTCGRTNYNIWGWGATNGKECESAKVWSTWDEALLGFITGFKQSFPTAEKFLNSYAYLGDYWYNPGNAGIGGCYYASYIYPSDMPETVKKACDSSNKEKCTKTNTSECVKTTSQDQTAYALYQSKGMNDLRKKIWNLSENNCGLYGVKEGKCQIFKQRDPNWANDKLINSTSGNTLGSAGCAVTSVSIAMTCSGTLKDPTNFSPKILNQELRKYQTGGGIEWYNPAISKLTVGFHYANSNKNFIGTPESKAHTLKNLMKSNSVVIIHTSSRKISPTAGTHFVVLSGIDGTTARILDPATGKVGQWSVSDIDQYIIYEW